MKKRIENNKTFFINILIIAMAFVIAFVSNFTLGLFDAIPESGGLKGAIQYIGETGSYWTLMAAITIGIGSMMHFCITLSKARKNRISFDDVIDDRIAKTEVLVDKISNKVSLIKTAVINLKK